jgi:hypothetical protein
MFGVADDEGFNPNIFQSGTKSGTKSSQYPDFSAMACIPNSSMYVMFKTLFSTTMVLASYV